MAHCLNLSKAGEYAIAALSRLAMESEQASSAEKPVSIFALARAQAIPLSFLKKIMAQCVRAGLVRSKTGPDGGITLSRPPGRITLLSIIEACEGSYCREACVFYVSRPCDGPDCQVYCPLREGEQVVRDGLERITLEQMSGALGRHPLLKAQSIMEEIDGNSGRR